MAVVKSKMMIVNTKIIRGDWRLHRVRTRKSWKISALVPKPQALNSKPEAQNPKPQTLSDLKPVWH